MAKCVFLATIFLLFISCDRPPVQKDIPVRNVSDNSVDHSGMHRSSMQSSPNAAAAPYGLQFIDTMIAHHHAAIDTAQMAATRAGHIELKQLAAGIVADQQKEIAMMREWRTKYFRGAEEAVNMELPGMSEGMSEMDLEKLDTLKENAFDVEFVRQMIPHHQGAVTMAKDALGKPSPPPELESAIRELSGSIIASQSAEIEVMKEWQNAWGR